MEIKSIRPGLKTSEFWMSFVPVVGSVAATLSQNINVESKWGLIASALASAAYTISRGLAKSKR